MDARGERETGDRGAGAGAIDVAASGVRIDGSLLETLTVSALTDLFGAPRIEPTDTDGASRTGWAIWDGVGARVSTKDGEEAAELSIQLVDDPAWSERISDAARRFFPERSFPGTFTIEGRPPLDAISEDDLRTARAFLTASTGGWETELSLSLTECGEIHRMEFPEWFAKSGSGEVAEIVRRAEHPFREATICSAAPKPTRRPAARPSGRWKLRPATEPVVELASFPFRLAVVQELMYEQELLRPRFDVHDFARDQGAKSFEPDAFGDRMIPSVRSWFRRLPIPLRLAERVETLVLDGGNDVYLQLIPGWDGEDDRFAITSLTEKDLAPFTRLRSVDDIGGLLGPRARAALAERGITVE